MNNNLNADYLNNEKEQNKLIKELEKGRKSGEDEGWISSKDVREYFNNKSL